MAEREPEPDRSAYMYPTLFEQGPTPLPQPKTGSSVPDVSIYDDASYVAAHAQKSARAYKLVTVFGYSPQNLDSVRAKFGEYGKIADVSYGNNWMDIRYSDDRAMFKALTANCTIVNGEMIGTAQRARKDALLSGASCDVFAKKSDGVVGRISRYLFGEQPGKSA